MARWPWRSGAGDRWAAGAPPALLRAVVAKAPGSALPKRGGRGLSVAIVSSGSVVLATRGTSQRLYALCIVLCAFLAGNASRLRKRQNELVANGTQIKYNQKTRKVKKIVQAIERGALKYVPTPWAVDSWVNLLASLVRSQFLWAMDCLGESKFQNEEVACRDEGRVLIQWLNDEVTKQLPNDAPVLCLLPTAIAKGRGCLDFLREVPGYGWRACVFARHGEVLPLSAPRFNLVGDYEDVVEQMRVVRGHYPNAYIGMVGLSAGSGLLVSYLGRQGGAAPVQVGASLCPAYDDLRGWLQDVKLADWLITHSVKRLFLRRGRNRGLLRRANREAFDACERATTMEELLTAHCPFAGPYEDLAGYLEDHNPVNFYEHVPCPLLVLRSQDDPICNKMDADKIIASSPNCCLVLTQTGSHVAFSSGVLAQRQWMTVATMEFFQAAKRIHDSEARGDSRGVTRLTSA